MKFSAIAVLSVVMLLHIGCSETRTYSISVKNETPRPLTLGLVKDAPPYNDPNWASPEDLAILHAHSDEQAWGVIVPPGKTGTAGPLDAKFSSDGNAWLRIYSGQLAVTDLLAISKDSPNRLDIRLKQGENNFIVSGRNALTAERLPSTMPVAVK